MGLVVERDDTARNNRNEFTTEVRIVERLNGLSAEYVTAGHSGDADPEKQAAALWEGRPLPRSPERLSGARKLFITRKPNSTLASNLNSSSFLKKGRHERPHFVPAPAC